MDAQLKNATILIVDDLSQNIDVLREILKQSYNLKIATNGARAIKIANGEVKPDLILLDVMMPEMDGYEVCRQLKSNYNTADIPVIFVTAKGDVADESYGFDMGAVDYITKPVSAPLVLRRVQTHLHLYDNKRLLETLVKEKIKLINDSRFQIIKCLGRAAEYKDNETGAHVVRMSHYAEQLAIAAGFDAEQAELLLHASIMHDIGKIGIADNILLKPAKLNNEEWNAMKQHPFIGSKILGDHDSVLLNMAKEIAMTHHEKFNGQGYPHGLKGEDIPISGRIVAIADVFDALTADRPYKRAWTVDEAINLLQQESGKHFDPDLVNKFLGIMPKIIKLMKVS